MKKMKRLLIVLSFGCFIAVSPSARADTKVFDNLAGAGPPFFGPGCCAIGDEITLGGTAEVSQLKLGVFTQGIDLMVAIGMAIYANDGTGGSPGTLLWQSGALTGLLVPADATEITVQVPRIAVPDVITVTSYIFSSIAINPATCGAGWTWCPIALGRLSPAPPTVGSSHGAWLYADWLGQWEPIGGEGYYALEVDAVPEPPPNILLAIALLCVGLVASKSRLWLALNRAMKATLQTCRRAFALQQ